MTVGVTAGALAGLGHLFSPAEQARTEARLERWGKRTPNRCGDRPPNSCSQVTSPTQAVGLAGKR